jgi:GTPase Era involved in 16S rRNA processing
MSEEKNKNAWLKFGEKGKQDIFNFCEGYKNYMSVCKTERESVLEAIRLAEEKGYRDLNLIIKNGETLKRIGTYAREDLERFFGVKVYINLWVKVKEKWRDSTLNLNNLGYNIKEILS